MRDLFVLAPGGVCGAGKWGWERGRWTGRSFSRGGLGITVVYLGYLASVPQEGESLVGVAATGMGFGCRRRTGGGWGEGLDRYGIGGILRHSF